MKKVILLLLAIIGLSAGYISAQCRHERSGSYREYRQHGRRHGSPYMITGNRVVFEGHVIDGASPSGFIILKDGYAKDTWNVYFDGKKISGASTDSFRALRDGYAVDTWNAYFDGAKINGASPDSFKVLRNGYAEDTWNTYYFGRKI